MKTTKKTNDNDRIITSPGQCAATPESPCALWEMLTSQEIALLRLALELKAALNSPSTDEMRQRVGRAWSLTEGVLKEAGLEGLIGQIGEARPEPAAPTPEEAAEIRSRLEELGRRKREFDEAEDRRIGELEGSLDQGTLGELEEERSRKRRVDRELKRQMREARGLLDGAGGQEPPSQEEVKELVGDAITNTIAEAARKGDRSPETSNNPSGQQGPGKPNAGGGAGKRRGAPKGHAGYAPSLTGPDGREISEMSLDELKELSASSNLELVILMPGDVPEGAEVRHLSTRVGVGQRREAVPIAYAQMEATWRDPENRRKIRRKRGEYPGWLRRTGCYSDDYKVEAAQLRLVANASYSRAAGYLSGAYGVPITPMTVWLWVRQFAERAEALAPRFRKALSESGAIFADETGIRDEGRTKWAYVCANDKYTYFTVSDHRDFEALEENGVILNASSGTVVMSDGYRIYQNPKVKELGLKRQRCIAHKKRHAKQILKFESRENRDVLDMLDWFRDAMEARSRAEAEGRDSIPPAELRELEDRFDKVSRRGLRDSEATKAIFDRRVRDVVIRAAMGRLLGQADSYLSFLEGGPPYAAPWRGTELSGKKNPEAVAALASAANEIDRAAERANRDGEPIPEGERGRLREAFLGRARLALEEFKDSAAKLHYRETPKLRMVSTELSKFFADLVRDRDAYLLFLRDFRAEPTNNLAERAIRPLKLAVKVSGSFRGHANEHALLQGYTDSARKQGRDALEALRELLAGNEDYLFGGGAEPAGPGPGAVSIKTVPKVNEERRAKKASQEGQAAKGDQTAPAESPGEESAQKQNRQDKTDPKG